MKNLKIEVSKLLPDYVIMTSPDFTSIDEGSIFGTKFVPIRTFRDEQKRTVKVSGVRHFFISDVMYKDRPDMESFRYMIIYTQSQVRPYRCKTWHDHQLDKVYLSGKTDDELLTNLTQIIQEGKP